MADVKVVIGDRLGKGQKVGMGVEAAGGSVTVIPGMAADMKLGDIMKQEEADFGISFCGSGGAGAITAQNKYGYKCLKKVCHALTFLLAHITSTLYLNTFLSHL